MNRYTIKIDGMKCPMCEEHVSTLFKKNVDRAIQVKASHSKNICVILSDIQLDEDVLYRAVNGSGYRIQGITKEENLKDTLSFRFAKKHYRFTSYQS